MNFVSTPNRWFVFPFQVALGSFYDNDSGDDVTFQDASDEPRPADRGPQEVVDLSGEDAVEGLGRIEGRGVGSRKHKTSSSSSARLHTINDFGKEAEAESDSGEEGETFYAGGSDHGRYIVTYDLISDSTSDL